MIKSYKPRIGLDLDGVIVNWHRNVLRMMNFHRGYKFDLDFESPYWNWIKENIKPEDWKWLWTDAMLKSYTDADPYAGAVDFARFLRSMGDVIILTSRPEGSWTGTMNWWERWIGYTAAGYNFFRDGKKKGQVRCDIFIEDNYQYAFEYHQANPFATIILFDRPWNQAVNGDPSWLVRAHSYSDVIAVIVAAKQ